MKCSSAHPGHGRIFVRRLGMLALPAAFAGLVGLSGCDSHSGTSHPIVKGAVSYDHVPAVAEGSGTETATKLDYANTVSLPARSVVVEAVSPEGDVLASTVTADDGSYLLEVPQRTDLYIRVRAELLHGSAEAPEWRFSVRDNTSAGYATAPTSAAEYAIVGETFNTSRNNWVRDLHATSGWTGSAYDPATRVAAPFQLLDQVETAARKLKAEEATLVLPELSLFWSPQNRPVPDGTEQDIGSGLIGTSFYSHDEKTYGLYLLGAENVDTDEYDLGVLVHEFGHYVEDKLSRSDNIGGDHAIGEALDMRVAFGEAWGDAFSSMVRDTPLYVDTRGAEQAEPGLVLDLDAAGESPTWYGETAVGYALYALYKAPEVGFGAIYQTLRNEERTTPAWTSLFSFATGLRGRLETAGQAKLDAVLTELDTVNGTALDAWGTNQTFQSSQPELDPLITPVTTVIDANAKLLCVSNQLGTANKLANWRYLRFSVATAGRYQLIAQPTEGDDPNNWGFVAMQAGQELEDPRGDDAESGGLGVYDLQPGEYAAAVSHKAMIEDKPDNVPAAQRCAYLTLAPN